jgi:ribosomal protein S18 acetylase RimI-like enzyme
MFFGIRRAEAGEDTRRVCEEILRSLPAWFGIESALLEYAAQGAVLPTWIGAGHDGPVGFVTLREHFPESAEINCIAVRPEFHRRGLGRALLLAAEEHARGRGAGYLQVKTMGPSRPNREYAETLEFYRGVGFARLEELKGFWNGLPCLVLVKRL